MLIFYRRLTDHVNHKPITAREIQKFENSNLSINSNILKYDPGSQCYRDYASYYRATDGFQLSSDGQILAYDSAYDKYRMSTIIKIQDTIFYIPFETYYASVRELFVNSEEVDTVKDKFKTIFNDAIEEIKSLESSDTRLSNSIDYSYQVYDQEKFYPLFLYQDAFLTKELLINTSYGVRQTRDSVTFLNSMASGISGPVIKAGFYIPRSDDLSQNQNLFNLDIEDYESMSYEERIRFRLLARVTRCCRYDSTHSILYLDVKDFKIYSYNMGYHQIDCEQFTSSLEDLREKGAFVGHRKDSLTLSLSKLL